MRKLRINILNEEHNRAVQDRLFKLGYEWPSLIGKQFRNPEARKIYTFGTESLSYTTDPLWESGDTSMALVTLDMLYDLKQESKDLEPGNWYRNKDLGSRFMFYFDGYKDHYYGWGVLDTWSESLLQYVSRDSVNTDAFRKATDEEVLDRFRTELESRGFVDGCEWTFVKGIVLYNFTEYSRGKFTISTEKDEIQSNRGYVFSDGNFGIPEANVLPRIAGHGGKFTDTGVSYGCTDVDYDFILSDTFDHITSLDFGGQHVIKSDLKAVKEAVKNRHQKSWPDGLKFETSYIPTSNIL